MEHHNGKKRVFSGIQPTGTLHIGNYFGAIKDWITLQEKEELDCFFSVVDLHAITIPYNHETFHEAIISTFSTLVACGIEPSKSTLFIQSHISEHPFLAWLLSSVAPYGDLSRMTQFKDKSATFEHNINAGLFTYPVLMSADILLYDSAIVPVGQDQLQHLELTREIARRFNDQFAKDFFKIPNSLLKTPLRLKGLDGENKMSKSLHNYIGLTESKESLSKKIRGAKTDPARIHKTDKGHPEICNIYSYHQFFSSKEEQENVFKDCSSAKIGCSDCKSCLISNMWNFLSPIKERKETLDARKDDLNDLIHLGAKKAKAVASERIEKISKIMGF